MTSFIVTTGDNTAKTLANVEIGVVGSGGVLSTGFADAVTMTGYAILTVQGTINTFSDGVQMANGGQIVVATGGVINAGSFALFMTGDSTSDILEISNAGILNGLSGIGFSGQQMNLVNSGTINGYSSFGAGIVMNSLAGPSFITNSGTIGGTNYGILSNGTTLENITNSGMISGNTGAMRLSNAASIVINTGVIGGVVLLNGGADRFDGLAGVQGNVQGGAGNDTVYGGAADEALFGDADSDRLRGNGGHDSLNGGLGTDSLAGNAGDDVLSGEAGADLVAGGDGDDTVSGGADADRLYGGAGDDVVYGGTGAFNDTLWGGLGDDTLSGSTGADTFVFARGQGTDRITDFANNVDKLDLRAFDFASVAAVTALASASSFGLRIDVPGEGVVFVAGLTLAALNATDLLL